jgi:hypothetical protein
MAAVLSVGSIEGNQHVIEFAFRNRKFAPQGFPERNEVARARPVALRYPDVLRQSNVRSLD